MGKHRKEDRHTPESDLSNVTPEQSGPQNGKPLRNKVVAAVVATGAFVAIGQPLAANAGESADRAFSPVAAQQNLGQVLSDKPRQEAAAAPEILQSKAAVDAEAAKRKMDQSRALQQEREQAEAAKAAAEAREAAERQAAEQQAAEQAAREQAAASGAAGAVNSSGYAKPAEGSFTSGFGARWGSSHNGIDIANDIGTPIHSVSGGEVISAGPASGFGQWVRVQHDDGTITVYGHINTIDVSEGQSVEAGEQIATMGNEGQSTGPHLHFEVLEGGSKINPLPWLQDKGINVQ